MPRKLIQSKPYDGARNSSPNKSSDHDIVFDMVSRSMNISTDPLECVPEDNDARNRKLQEIIPAMGYQSELMDDALRQSIEEYDAINDTSYVLDIEGSTMPREYYGVDYVPSYDSRLTADFMHAIRSKRGSSAKNKGSNLLTRADTSVNAWRAFRASMWRDPDPVEEALFYPEGWPYHAMITGHAFMDPACWHWYNAYAQFATEYNYRRFRITPQPQQDTTGAFYDHRDLHTPVVRGSSMDGNAHPQDARTMLYEAYMDSLRPYILSARDNSIKKNWRARAEKTGVDFTLFIDTFFSLAPTMENVGRSAFAFPACGNPRCVNPWHQRLVERGERIPFILPVLEINRHIEEEEANSVRYDHRLEPSPTILANSNNSRAHILGPMTARSIQREDLPVDDLPWGMASTLWRPILPRMARVAEHPAGFVPRPLPTSAGNIATRRQYWADVYRHRAKDHSERFYEAEKARWGHAMGYTTVDSESQHSTAHSAAHSVPVEDQPTVARDGETHVSSEDTLTPSEQDETFEVDDIMSELEERINHETVR